MKPCPNRPPVIVALTLVALFALPPAVSRQAAQGQPTFRLQVEYVAVDAIARDKDGQFVADLKKDDFEILEDGKRQDIATFDRVDVPTEPRPAVSLLSDHLIEPDVVTNTEPPGRVYLIVLDDLHVAPQRTPAVRKMARQFVERSVAPNDMAAVVTTTGTRTNAQSFTNNRRLLLEAIDRFVGRKPMSPGASQISNTLTTTDPNAVNGIAIPSARPTAVTADPGARERFYNARSSLQTLADLAAFAGTVRNRRKALVLFGEGIDYRVGASTEMANIASDTGDASSPPLTVEQRIDVRALRDDFRRFVQAANRANVTLYALDPRVYTQGGDDLVDVGAGVLSDTRSGNEVTNLGTLRDDMEASQDNLRAMASETGGFAMTGSLKAADTAYTRIRDENSHYYLLGYYPTNDKRDGKFRRIAVRVKRPGVQVEARKGYVAAGNEKARAGAAATPVTKDGTSAPLREALGSALPSAGLPLSASATPFRSAGGVASVLVMVQTPPGAVQFVDKGERVEGHLEVSVVALDYQSKARGGEHLDLAMPLKRETAAVVGRTGFLVQSRIALPPGRYMPHVGARDANSERVGTVFCDLEVPDYGKSPLAMSGLVVASEQTALANPRPDKELPEMPGSPAVIRDFRPDDQLAILAEIYAAKSAPAHDIDIVTTLVGEDGREAYRHEEKRSTGELGGAAGGFGYLLNVPLAAIAPGSYLLRVEARSRMEAGSSVARETMVRVLQK